MALSRHAQTEFGFPIFNAVSACNGDSCFLHLIGGPFQDLLKHFDRKCLFRETNDAQCEQGFPAHRVNIAQCIGRGDRPIRIRIIHDRWNEINGLDDGFPRGYQVDCGIVGGFRTDEEVGIIGLWQSLQDPLQGLRPDLAGAAQRMRIFRKFHRFMDRFKVIEVPDETNLR